MFLCISEYFCCSDSCLLFDESGGEVDDEGLDVVDHDELHGAVGELTIFEPENGISVAIERYRGYLYNDKKEGYGVFEFRNGDREEMVFVGYFLNNDFTDEGVWYNADGVYDKYTSEYISKYPYPDDCLWIGDNRLNVG